MTALPLFFFMARWDVKQLDHRTSLLGTYKGTDLFPPSVSPGAYGKETPSVMARLNTFIHKYFYESCRFYDPVFFFREEVLGGRSRFNHFKKFARRANFLKCCRGGVWGAKPLQEIP